MRFRYLRIAWSAACGIACVLLIVLWVLVRARGRGVVGAEPGHEGAERCPLIRGCVRDTGRIYVGEATEPVEVAFRG